MNVTTPPPPHRQLYWNNRKILNIHDFVKEVECGFNLIKYHCIIVNKYVHSYDTNDKMRLTEQLFGVV
jgi:hypothetical protein